MRQGLIISDGNLNTPGIAQGITSIFRAVTQEVHQYDVGPDVLWSDKPVVHFFTRSK